MTEVRQFLGLALYYRRFIKGFAKTAQPLHSLTQKGALFHWSHECEEAFQQLKQRLIESPILIYPDFSEDFVLETDASALGLGAVLSQPARDGRLHPVAYASRSLSPQEKRYAITELETLAVVWAVSHFHAYLYGHDVQVFTDHSAVKAVLETPNPSGKHARWWSRTFGSGIKNLCPVGGDHTHTSVTDVQVAQVRSTAKDVAELLQTPPVDTIPDTSNHFSLSSKGETLRAWR